MAGRGWLRATARAHAGALVILAGAAAVFSLAACSRPTAEQPLPGMCTPFRLVSSMPESGAQQVPVDAPIELRFSDFPDPDTVTLGTVQLSSGLQVRLGTFTVDLVDRSVRFDTRNYLSPNLTYLVTLTTAVTSLTGCATKATQLPFRTGPGPADPPPPPPVVPTLEADVLPVFAARCAGSTCHRQAAEAGGGCLATPAKGLSLCDQEARASLVGAAAIEVDGALRVVPGDAARSLLLRKLVPGPTGGPVPTTPGHRDPPDEPPLPTEELRLISDWIDQGAR